MELTLYIGNKNYSSWSFRGWLAMRMTGAPFREVLFHLGDPASREKIRAVSPGGRVPALHHGELGVWDSLAIAEYLARPSRSGTSGPRTARRAPPPALWPRRCTPASRTCARTCP